MMIPKLVMRILEISKITAMDTNVRCDDILTDSTLEIKVYLYSYVTSI